MIRLLYLGYPIDQNWSPRAGLHIANVRGSLDRSGIPHYDPGRALVGLRGVEPGPEVWAINHRALTAASHALFVAPAGVPTVGVPREIQVAVHAGIPTAVLTDVPSWSLGVAGEAVFPIDGAPEALTWLSRQQRAGNQRALLGVKILAEGGRLPGRHYTDDAGLDLYVSEDREIRAGEFVDVPTGIAVEIPPVAWGMIKSRSSTLRSKGLLVHDGVIDPGWRGELFAGVWNLNPGGKVRVKEGERIAQLILHTNVTTMYEPVEVFELGESPRGTNGFGSTGD